MKDEIVRFTATIPGLTLLDKAFEPVQRAVTAAHLSGKQGAVFCQLIQSESGQYKITGAFYPLDKAKIINDVLVKVKATDD